MRTQPNPTLVATCGLRRLHARRGGGGSSFARLETGEDGRLELRAGGMLHGRYRPTGVLGRGTFAETWRAEDVTDGGRAVAVKVMNARFGSVGESECAMLRRVRGLDPGGRSGCVRLLDAFWHGPHCCLVLELLRASLLEAPPPGDAGLRKVALQLVVALGLLARAGVVHADVKPENVLLTGADGCCGVRLVDFGNSMAEADAELYYDDFEVQTLFYRAPEVLVGLPFGPPVDAWSLGCVLAERHSGRPLFPGQTAADVAAAMVRVLGPMPFTGGALIGRYAGSLFGRAVGPRWRLNSLSDAVGSKDRGFVTFLGGLLEYDPGRRLAPADALFHPYLTGICPVDLVLGPRVARGEAGGCGGAGAGGTKEVVASREALLPKEDPAELPPPPPPPPPGAPALPRPPRPVPQSARQWRPAKRARERKPVAAKREAAGQEEEEEERPRKARTVPPVSSLAALLVSANNDDDDDDDEDDDDGEGADDEDGGLLLL